MGGEDAGRGCDEECDIVGRVDPEVSEVCYLCCQAMFWSGSELRWGKGG